MDATNTVKRAARELTQELGWILEADGVQAQLPRGFGVLCDVINVQRFRSGDAESVERCLVDCRRGFARADAAGIDARREVASEQELAVQTRGMERVGIGKQGQAVLRAQPREQTFLENRVRIECAIPCRAEFLESERQSQASGEVSVPFKRRDSALLPVLPARVSLNRGPQLFRGRFRRRTDPGSSLCARQRFEGAV